MLLLKVWLLLWLCTLSMILLCGSFPPPPPLLVATWMLRLSVSPLCLERTVKVTAWTAINLYSWNPITPSSFGAHVNTASCEDELLPISCVHRVLCIPESRHLTFGPLGHNKHAFCSYSTRIYFQTSAAGQVKNKENVIFVSCRNMDGLHVVRRFHLHIISPCE